MKLYTFGCSFTYGTGLKDCWAGDYKSGPRPSRYAWPTRLSRSLRIPVFYNFSKSGSSNKRIAQTALQRQYDSDDVIIFLWTMPGRDTIFDQDPHNSWDLFPHGRAEPKHIQKQYHKYIAYHSDYSLMITEYMHMNLADRHCRDYTNNVFHFAVPEIYEQYQFDWNRVQLLDYANLEFSKHGAALDGAHPDESAHHAWANRVSDIVKPLLNQANAPS
jgi:lysophospholipase L1-like esterase